MAPAPTLDAASSAALAQLALPPPKLVELSRPNNAAQLRALCDAVEHLHLHARSGDADAGGLEAKTINLVIVAAAAKAQLSEAKRRYLIARVADGSLDGADRVDAASKYLASTPSDDVDKAEFDRECGVGATVSEETIAAHVARLLEPLRTGPSDGDAAAAVWGQQSALMASLRAEPELRWAPAVAVKTALEKELEKSFGSRAEALKRAREKQAAEAKAAKAAKAAKPTKEAVVAPAEADPDAMFRDGFLSRLHAPGGNPQQSDALREQHLKATGGRVFTRFPPEPNGYLHVGHIKAIAVDFGYARYHGGQCYLRFDDTNPEAESEEYFEAILEMVRWLGFEPFKITYSSDYFDQLYALAVELIRRGKAYVDHSTPEEIKQGRGGEERGPRVASKWRDRPIEESLADFEAMRDGKYPPGKVTLRMKQDLLGSGNPQMWDLIAYRVLDAPHHRTGTRWKIYPTYDFTHCLVDSFENISHSLCTTEFILSRESYEWLCDALDVYKPRQYEFGRLALEGTVTSKRKILKLVSEKHVNGWDDPRLFTMMALRRRGIPPGALLSFVNQLGVTTSPATTSIMRFEQAVRQYLEMQTPRLMMVVRPLRIVLENVPEDFVLQLERPLHPKNPAMGTARVPFARVNYIDASDFRAVDSPDYFRLAPGKTVGLLNAPFPVTCTSWVDAAGATSGEPVEVRVRYEDPAHGGNAQSRSKTYVQWVGEHAPSGSPVIIDEVRTYERLFTVDNPAGEANFLDTINPNSLQVMQGAMIETGFWHVAASALREARKVAESRTQAAQEEAHRATAAEESAIAAGSVGATHTGDGAPKRKADQLVGNEVVRFQGMRIAYFALDKESSLECLREGAAADAAPRKGTSDRLVLNRIVTLKEDSGKSGVEAPKK